MFFNTAIFSAIAVFAASASAQTADSCAAGAIIGIQAVCGTNPQDCGSGRCCLSDQTCVASGSTFACADSNLVPGSTQTVRAGCYATAGSTPTSSTSSIIPPSSTSSISPPLSTSSIIPPSSYGSTTPSSAPAAPTGAASGSPTGAVPSTTIVTRPSSSKGPHIGTGGGSYVTATAPGVWSSSAWGNNGPSYSASIVTSVVAAPYTFTNGSINYPTVSVSGSGSGPKSTSTGVLQSNSATSAFASPQNSFAMLVSAAAVVAFWL